MFWGSFFLSSESVEETSLNSRRPEVAVLERRSLDIAFAASRAFAWSGIFLPCTAVFVDTLRNPRGTVRCLQMAHESGFVRPPPSLCGLRFTIAGLEKVRKFLEKLRGEGLRVSGYVKAF